MRGDGWRVKHDSLQSDYPTLREKQEQVLGMQNVSGLIETTAEKTASLGWDTSGVRGVQPLHCFNSSSRTVSYRAREARPSS